MTRSPSRETNQLRALADAERWVQLEARGMAHVSVPLSPERSGKR